MPKMNNRPDHPPSSGRPPGSGAVVPGRRLRPLFFGLVRALHALGLGEGRFEVLDWDDNVPDNEAR